MSSAPVYDVIIVGGGLAGLSAAILLAGRQYKVLLLEKETYPRHKVCGEYISMESRPFLERLGLHLDDMSLPVMNRLHVTDTHGNAVHTHLPQGGFGISRYTIDAALAHLATTAGATVLTKTKVDNVEWQNDTFTVTVKDQQFSAAMVCGAWGKRSNIDVKWQRPFITEKNKALSNYVGIKYHINCSYPRDVVGLHNFTDGYCGISAIEDDKYCLCYLTTAANLQQNGNDIKKMEQLVLMKNPVLNDIFSNAEFLYEHPLAISQISFEQKELVHDHVLLLGDTAGMITPLCGNGMSMAMHAAHVASGLIDEYMQGSISRAELERRYITTWKNKFATRIALGRMVQANFGKDKLTSFFLKTMNTFPFIGRALVKGTSGAAF